MEIKGNLYSYIIEKIKSISPYYHLYYSKNNSQLVSTNESMQKVITLQHVEFLLTDLKLLYEPA